MINLLKISKKTFIRIFISISLPFLLWLCVVTSGPDNISCILFIPLTIIWLAILLIWLIIDFIVSIKSRKSIILAFVILGAIFILWYTLSPFSIFRFSAIIILIEILLLLIFRIENKRK